MRYENWMFLALATLVACSGGPTDAPEPVPAPAPAAEAPAPAPAPAPAAAEGPQSIVLITMDTVRGDFMTFAGHDQPTTPYLQTLADNGVYFTQAFAPCSWTAPSMASIMTGVYPTTHGVSTGKFNGKTGEVRQPILGDDFGTLAEVMKEAGYTTIGIPSNRHLAAELGFKQGFDHYVDKAPFMEADAVNTNVRELLTAAYGENWKEDWKKEKTFLWIHYFDPHVPYKVQDKIELFAPDFATNRDAYPVNTLTPKMEERYKTSKPEDVKYIRATYAQGVRYLDDKIAEIGGELGLDDPNVATVVTSDHGEELLDHKSISHGKTLYNEVVRIPFLVHWKAGDFKARGLNQPVSLLDVLPTMADIAGGKIPDGVQGISQLKVLKGETPPEARDLLFEVKPRHGGPKYRLVGFTDGTHKIVRSREVGKQATTMYDLKADDDELKDLVASKADVVASLEAKMVKMMDSLVEAEDVEELQQDDPELLKELEALGYIGD